MKDYQFQTLHMSSLGIVQGVLMIISKLYDLELLVVVTGVAMLVAMILSGVVSHALHIPG